MKDKGKRKKAKEHRCTYCGVLIPYEGSCESCGRKEDIALRKRGLI